MELRIKDLSETPAKIVVLMKNLEEKVAKNGKPYVVATIMDGTNEAQAKIWDTSVDKMTVKAGDIVEVTAKADNYGVTISSYVKCTDSRIKMSDFIPTAPIAPETLYDRIIKMVDDNVDDLEIARLTKTLYEKFKDTLIKAPAAKMMHHNIVGGLLWHQFCMMQVALHFCVVYGDVINKSLVIAGCALHDIGKIYEMDSDDFLNTEYTVDGMLLGHLYMGAELIEIEGRKLNVSAEKRRNLKHIIVSHHGEPEMGAITRPQTLEAYLVSEIDMMDSKIYQYEKAAEGLESGETSDKVYGLKNIKVYKV